MLGNRLVRWQLDMRRQLHTPAAAQRHIFAMSTHLGINPERQFNLHDHVILCLCKATTCKADNVRTRRAAGQVMCRAAAAQPRAAAASAAC